MMLALYANDSVYFISLRRADLAARKIKRVFDVLFEWLDKWMTLNVGRTTALLTGSRRIMPAQLRLRGQYVEWRTCVRYLGVSNVPGSRCPIMIICFIQAGKRRWLLVSLCTSPLLLKLTARLPAPGADTAHCEAVGFSKMITLSKSLYDVSHTLRLGVTYEKGVTLGNVTMSHRTRERPAECLASLSHSTMIGLPRAQH
ncbi:hypothetical protein EVAR_14317_1 [Eumeta japonica]|uniref:Reverse transcriptase domain-containing protein n=1 Tax=Eumeta variegata TaxID=151549 RepID=A0A4C1UNC8_EUMVA|nr:hypothetical protein EVAR_14317_1 [Eumeta japonica]